MKPAIGLLFFLLVFVTFPLRAQETPQGMERAAILSVGGEMAWGVGINGQAVGWAMARPHHGVTVAARLGNGGGHAYANAYLMKSIGPGTSESDEVARTSFDLTYPHDGWINLFTDLELEAGIYWLIVAKPRERAHSSINWFVARPMNLWASCGMRYLGTKSYTFHGDAAEYIPASKFERKYEPYGFQVEVTEARAPGSDCP